MSTEHPESTPESRGCEERQLTLEESTRPPDAERCEAIADSTGERCQRAAISGIPYCGLHKDLLDEVDIVRIGLNALESGG